MKTNTKTIVLIGVLSAMSAVLYFLQFPVLPAAPWLKVDFSDVPALLASIAISPLAGLLVVTIKNIIHLFATETGMVGELANFLIGSTFVIFAGILTKVLAKNTLMKYKLVLVLIVASVLQAIAGVIVNYYIMVPLYFGNSMKHSEIVNYVIASVIPFNLIKDTLASVVFYLTFRYIYPKIQKQLY